MSAQPQPSSSSLNSAHQDPSSKESSDPFGDFEPPRLPSLETDANDDEAVAHLKRVLNKEFGPWNAWHRMTRAPYVKQNTHVVAVAGTLPGTSSPSHQGWHLTELLFWYHLYTNADLGSKAFLTCVNLGEAIKQYKRLLWCGDASEPRKIVLDDTIYKNQFADIETGNLAIRDGSTIDKAYLMNDFLDQVQTTCRRADQSGQESHVLVFIFSDGNSAGELRIGSHFLSAEHIRQRVEDTGTKSRVTIITSASYSAGLTYLNLDVSCKPLKKSMVANESVLLRAYREDFAPQPPIFRNLTLPFELVNYLLAPEFSQEISHAEHGHLRRTCPSYIKLAARFLNTRRVDTLSKDDSKLRFDDQDELYGIDLFFERTKTQHFDYIAALAAIQDDITKEQYQTYDSSVPVTVPCGILRTEVAVNCLVTHRLRPQASAYLVSLLPDCGVFYDPNGPRRCAFLGCDHIAAHAMSLVHAGHCYDRSFYRTLSDGLDWHMTHKWLENFYERLLNIDCIPSSNEPVNDGRIPLYMILTYDLFGVSRWERETRRYAERLAHAISSKARFPDFDSLVSTVKLLKHVSFFTTGSLALMLRDAFSDPESIPMQLLAQLRRERRANPFLPRQASKADSAEALPSEFALRARLDGDYWI